MADLTEEQAAIYDRQIRVWGADVQRSLTDAKVLLIGCTPLASEVAKNFVLAGIGQLTVIDDAAAASAPLTFLHQPGLASKGASVAAMFAAGLQELNPMVTVQTAAGAASDLPDDPLIKAQHLVLAFGHHAGQQARLNALCRKHDVSFIAARTLGPNAVAFADLQTHAFKLPAQAEGDDTEQHISLSYKPLADVLGVPWSELERADKRQLNPLLPVWAVAAAAELEHDRFLQPDDLAALDEAGKARAAEGSLRAGAWRGDVLAAVIDPGENIAAVNAIVGGFLGNDVVRAVSHVGMPTHNVLCFRLEDNIVQMHNLTGTPNLVRNK